MKLYPYLTDHEADAYGFTGVNPMQDGVERRTRQLTFALFGNDEKRTHPQHTPIVPNSYEELCD